MHVSNNSCAADGRFDKQVEKLVKTFYDKIEEFCNTKPLPRRLDNGLVGELHRVLEKLYDLLIEPFCESSIFMHLDPKATIVFVPDKVCVVVLLLISHVPLMCKFMLRNRKLNCIQRSTNAAKV